MTETLLIMLGVIVIALLSRRTPVVGSLGIETIIVVFVPSYLSYARLIPPVPVLRIRHFFDATDSIGIFIAIVIVGSILSIEGRALIRGLARIILPVCIGSILAALVGTLVGTLFGLKPLDALFHVVAPVMAGGLTAGALPLSVGYANVLGTSQGELLALMLPSVILGNLLAVIFGGLLNFFEIHVRRSGPDLGSSLESLAGNRAVAPAVVNKTGGPGIVAAVAVIGVLYLSGLASSLGLGLPAPLVVLALAAIMQASNLLTADLRRGVQAVYRLCVRFLTYPLLFIVGLLLTPWDKLVAGFSPIYLSTIGAVVTTLAVTGYVVSRWAKIRGVEGAIVVLSRAAMGGTGDIAILTAARRLQLMPFAQIATRIGGAATVALALIGVEHFGI